MGSRGAPYDPYAPYAYANRGRNFSFSRLDGRHDGRHDPFARQGSAA